MSEAQTITPERQTAAAQVGQVMNSVHQYLSTLMHANGDGQKLTSQPLEYARQHIEEASFWAVKHVLTYGMPAATAPVDPPQSNVGTVMDGLGDAPTGADALPPTTPAESV
jgi:hypothetical protein